MKIKTILSQSRRDFRATIYCEFCNKETTLNDGYDDNYYHTKVIPAMKCKHCNKSTVSENGTIDEVATKYPEGFQV